jgi:hypothetical protein
VLGARAIEVVRSLAMAGIPIGVVTPTGDPARWSRYARNVMTWDWMLPAERHDEALADCLVEFGRRQATRPARPGRRRHPSRPAPAGPGVGEPAPLTALPSAEHAEQAILGCWPLRVSRLCDAG